MVLSETEPEIKVFPDFISLVGAYDPWFVIFELFSQYKLDEMRQLLSDFYKAAIRDRHTYQSGKQLSDLMFFYNRLNDLATACYVLARKKWVDSPEYYQFEEDYINAEIFRQRMREFEATQK